MEHKTSFIKALKAVVWKDLMAELRSKEMISGMLIFSLLVIFIFNFSLELSPSTRASVTAGVIWVTIIFAGTIG